MKCKRKKRNIANESLISDFIPRVPNVDFINSRPHLLSRLLLRSYFLRLEEEYWRSPFLINFIGVIFEAGNETREKIWSGFGAEQK